jgi:hypothetical protein
MTIYRCVAPQWLLDSSPTWPRVKEGQFDEYEIAQINSEGYNVYFLPNTTSNYTPNTTVDGSSIDTFTYVFIDFDLKSGNCVSKEAFIAMVGRTAIVPTFIVDSGNGIHVYWQVSDLDAMSYLKLTRRLMRHFNTDPAVGGIYQLMRAPGTLNTKVKGDFKPCELLHQGDAVYTCEQLDAILPPLTHDDEIHCQQHFDKTYDITDKNSRIDDILPSKFGKLLASSKEVKDIWSCNTDDRSKSDHRLGHLMFAAGFTKAEALSVLVNCAKALSRAPKHRISYAEGIVGKIWTYEEAADKDSLNLSSTVKDILSKSGDTIKGTRFPCWGYLDNTAHGFRLGQVIGLVAGSGVGKTSVALNMFLGFVQNNPDYDHFFLPLEQTSNEIADRWKTMCGDKTQLHDKVHILSNYDQDGTFRHLSFDNIKDYLLKFQTITGKKVGCVVIDHIGALKKKGRDGENQDLMDICHQMKAFAVQTNTMLVMQSQAPREKAGIGDLELNKDAAYGTVYFESYCDYLLAVWQPLKRCYTQGAPTVTAYKFCKIRHKKQNVDIIKEDERYLLMFDSDTEHLREMTQDEETSFKFFNKTASNLRGQDRKTEVVSYTSVKWGKVNETL